MATISITNQTLTLTIVIDSVSYVIRKDNAKVIAYGDYVRITDYTGERYEFLYTDCVSPSESSANDLRDAIEEYLNTAGGGGGGGLDNITSTSLTVTTPSAGVKNIEMPYKVYSALITQIATDAPTATVLQNTMGVTMTWSRIGTGSYKVTAGSGIFLSAKTWTIINNINISGQIYYDINRSSNTEVIVASSIYDAGTPPYVPADDVISALSLEIRVYP
jgi:hypothetical protein